MNQIDKIKKSNKTNGVAAGVLFISATTAAIIGRVLYAPILEQSDFLTLGNQQSLQIVLGVVFELILACSNIGTAIMLYPYLRKYNETLGLGYVCFRMLEVVFILIGIVSVLSILTVSQLFSAATQADVALFQTVGAIFKAIYNWSFMLGPNFMLGVNTCLYSYVLYQSKLVPTKLAVIGILGAMLIFIAALLEMFGIILQMSFWAIVLALPIALYEMLLAVWLMTKGFDQNRLLQKSV